MDSAKAWELTADYDPGARVVTLALYRRDLELLKRAEAPTATTEISMGEGYSVALRMARRSLLARAGIREDQVLGA